MEALKLTADLLYMLLAAGAIYGGIRVDLRRMHGKIDANHDAINAKVDTLETNVHRRIDDNLGGSK